MNTKNTKKRFVLSLVVTIVSIAMLVGATFAWFTDSVTSGKNVITAGNLDIELTHSNGKVTDEDVEGQTDLFALDYWEPGAVAYENFTVKNVGNLALKYKLQLGLYDYNTITIDDEQHSLADVLKVYMQQGTFSGTREDAIALVEGENIGENSINGYAREAKLGPKGSASANDVYSVIIYWKPTDNDNLYNVNNGKTVDTLHNGLNELFVEFGVHLVATQDTVEADYFDEFYDKDSTYDMMPNFKKATGSSKTSRENDKNYGKTEKDLTIEINAKDLTGTSVKLGDAQVPKEAIDGVLDEFLNPMPENIPEGTVIKDDVVFTLNVETKSVKSDSTLLDITMNGEATRTKTKDGENEIIASKSNAITELKAAVSVPLKLQAGLKNMQVFHTHNDVTTEMGKVATKEEVTDGKFWYDENTGDFLAKMSKFSDVEIKYDPIENVARIGNTGYSSLYNAFEAAKAGETVVVLKDTAAPAVSEANITLDLGGFAVSGVAVQNSTLGVTGKGSLAATVGAGAMLNADSGEFTKLTLAGKGDVNLNGGKYEEVILTDGATINLSVNGGTYHLETAAEKEAFEAYLSDIQVLKETEKTGWYEIEYFDDNIVARIGNAGYTTIPAAVATVAGGQTIKMVKNVSGTVPSSGNDNYLSPISPANSGNRTFDLNGKTIAVDLGTWDFGVGSLIYLANSWSGTYGGTLTFKDSIGCGKISVTKETPTDGHRVAAVANDTHTFHNFVFESGTYEGTTAGVFFKAGSVTVNGGTFRGPIAFEYGVDDYGAKLGTVTINGGTFDGKFTIADFAHNKAVNLEAVVVNGGKFKTAEATPYLAEGKILVEKDGWFVVKDAADAPDSYTAKLVNKNGTAAYFSKNEKAAANEAIQCAINESVVYIKADADQTYVIKELESLTIVADDEDHEAKWEDGKATATENYEVKKETGAIENSTKYSSVKIAFFKVSNGNTYATVAELNNASISNTTVTLLRDLTTDTKITNSSSYTLDLGGHTLTYTGTGYAHTFNDNSKPRSVKNGTIKAENGSGLYKQYSGQGNSTTYNVNVVAKTYALNISQTKSGGVITVSGGTYTAETAINISTSGVTVSGGTFNGACNLGSATVTGGTFNGTLTASGKNIKGGKFTSDPTAYVMDGYHVDDVVTSGYYTVVKN